jgi:hypothetical protein
VRDGQLHAFVEGLARYAQLENVDNFCPGRKLSQW